MTAVLAPPAALSTTADLVLVRMALPGKSAPSKVRNDVGKLLGITLSAAELDDLRRSLTTDRFLVLGKRNVFTVTPEGRERAARFLKLEEFPPQLTWKQVIAKHLFPRAAGLTAEQAAKLDSGEQLAAHLLKQRFGLNGGTVGTLQQVIKAFVCKQLGYADEQSLDDIYCLVLSRLLGTEQRLKKKGIERQVANHQLNVPNLKAESIRTRVIRESLAARTVQIPKPDVPPEPFDLSAFANTVLKLARISPPDDRFHDNKVFIAPLWRTSQQESSFPRLTLAEFKACLLKANREGLLHLSRADLVQAMDPQLVAESETAHLTATFHFVRLEGDRP